MVSIQRPAKGPVIVGPGDDAGVYLLDDKHALVETVDIITPVVNDPFTFGSISAANSLSDVYAMGGKPLTALAIIGFSSCDYEAALIGEILKGAVKVLDSVDVKLMGGHSFEDNELKFGLSVTGIVNKERILRVHGGMPGDVIVITKPIGIGVITTALKGRKVKDEEAEDAVGLMLTLNDRASEAALNARATSATDVTGFGLLGHAYNMARSSSIDLVVDSRSVPVLEHVRDFILSGIVPEGAYNNVKFLEGKVEFSNSVSEDERLLLSDPQTSGGLLVTIPEANLEDFAAKGVPYWVIGGVEKGSGRLRIK